MFLSQLEGTYGGNAKRFYQYPDHLEVSRMMDLTAWL